MISLDKKNLPSYLFKLNVALVSFFIAWFALGVPLMVTIGCLYGEDVITYAVMASTFAMFFVGLAIFVIIDKKLHKRLIEERTAELEQEFCDMPFEEAKELLLKNGVITDDGFAVAEGVFAECAVVPFKEAKLEFGYSSANTKIYLSVCLGVKGQLMFDNTKAFYEMDKALYNFILKSGFDFFSDEINTDGDLCFELFKNDKKEFAKIALKYNKTLKANFKV